MNIGVTPENVEIYFFAAGLDPKSLDISVQQNVLTVSGERRIAP
jgi:HSP20 family protein